MSASEKAVKPQVSVVDWHDNLSAESILRMLRKPDGCSEIADRIANLLRICEYDDEADVQIASLWSIACFFVGIPKQRDVPGISVSPDGIFVAEWIGKDKAMVMEFLDWDEILLVRVFGDEHESRKVKFREAGSYLS